MSAGLNEQDLRAELTYLLNQLQVSVHDNAVEKGFWEKDDPYHVGLNIALIASEAFEALDGYRKLDNYKDSVIEELADVVIRALDVAAVMDRSLAEAILRKVEINKGRPRKHGRKF